MSRIPQLRVTALSKAFGGVLAVDQVSFDLEPRKVNSIIGMRSES